jgi:glycosyltransferase involved in cell wall biosynthesis
MSSKRTLEFVIPIYNERECLDALLDRLIAFRTKMNTLEVGVTFVNDGSSDGSWERLLEIAAEHPFVQLVDLSRNFGQQIAITAGLDHADADYVAIMDGDLQDPPELVETMYAKAIEGYDVVYGRRNPRAGETWFKRASAFAFYRVAQRVFGMTLPEDAGDFRLINRKVQRALAGMREQRRFLRGLVPWAGFRSAGVRYDRDARHAGATKYSLAGMLRFALDALFSFSLWPLRMLSLIGVLIVLLGSAAAAYAGYLELIAHRHVSATTAILIAVVWLGGAQLSALGLVGEYLGRISEESKRRPLYLVNQLKNARRASEHAVSLTEKTRVL